MATEKKRVSASTTRELLKALREQTGWSNADLISIMRGGGTSAKGSDYERELCVRLSLWWTRDKRDDIFWRSAASGARAKVRGRQGRDTAGQHGDIAATDAIGAPLTDLLTIEIKRGYSEYTIQDCLDRSDDNAQQEWETWFEQTMESYEDAGSFAWLMITRRDRRQAMAWFPKFLLKELLAVGAFPKVPVPVISMRVVLRDMVKQGQPHQIVGMHFEDFLAGTAQDHFIQLSKRV